jgi:hypothetical protein
MKLRLSYVFFILSILISFNALAINYQIIGPCSAIPHYQGNLNLNDLKVNLGKISLFIFEKDNIPFSGSEEGFSSILKTPTGDAAIEVLSKTKMRAYGWCFSVNGLIPDVLSSEYFFSYNEDKLVWFFAYSTYDSGKWVDYCVPSYTVLASQFCSKK